jgi:hypothetical protein
MQDNDEMMELDEHRMDSEIMRAIRYLDPDLCAERAEEDTGAAVGIGIILLTALTDALTCISLYVRDF